MKRNGLKNLPIGIQTFSEIIEREYLYVDKTEYLHRLITTGKSYFLSRPRRFGKSLTISTLDAIFQGKKELFKGLWIYTSDYEWEKHPVIRIDMSRISPNNTPEVFHRNLKIHLEVQCRTLGIIPLETDSAAALFDWLISSVAEKTRKQVVVLVDEYDKPLIDNLNNPTIAREIREILRGFYGVLKSLDDATRFIFLTGVTKFSRVSVFSGLNNLYDITMDPAYATMLGYTQQEMEHMFRGYITEFAKKEMMSRTQLVEQIKLWYNGFRFSSAIDTVYNPFSTLLLFRGQGFRNYWFESATPTFLVNLIKEKNYNIFFAEEQYVSEESFSTFEMDQLDILTLLLQTGYFTIKDYNSRRRLYRLGYPNKEVEIAFTKDVLGVFAVKQSAHVDTLLVDLENDLEHNNLESFFEQLRAFIADIPYTVRKARNEEQEYQLILYAILRCLGMNVGVEVTTNKGRIDAVIQIENKVYVCEFKLHGTKATALAQIKERGYYEKYKKRGKKIILVGVAIDRKKKNIGSFVSEEI